MFVKLTEKQIQDKISFIRQYMKADNAATASAVDANANVTTKNSCTLQGELYKDFSIQLKRAIITEKIKEGFGPDSAAEYQRQIADHEIYVHDESGAVTPYCCSISMYPFLLSGMESLGGEAKAPKHLSSFSGNYVNLCFAISAQVAGAVGTPEALLYFDHFAAKDYGDDYIRLLDSPGSDEEKAKGKEIENHLQSIVYAINQPAAARGFQSIFLNWAIFDRYYFDAVFKDFVFPDDFSKPCFDRLDRLQRYFLSWFNRERAKALLTFPVVTANLLTENGEPRDKGLAMFLAKEMSEGNSFFLFMHKNPHALSSCCRLANEMVDTSFSSSLGAGGVATGSMNVITMNVNRLVQDSVKDKGVPLDEALRLITAAVADQTRKIHEYQIATKAYFKELKDHRMLPFYDAGFVDMSKQFLTVGVNGILEGAEYLGLEPTANAAYLSYVEAVVKTIEDINKQARTKEFMFNLEMVPAENLGVKFASWDKKDGYEVKRIAYNSYLYRVEDHDVSVLEKMRLYSGEVSSFLSGGSAVHLNLEEYPDPETYWRLMCVAAKLGVPYWTTNILVTCCEEQGCRHIDKSTKDRCSKCGSENVSHATRIIGYLRKLPDFSKARKLEALKRSYSKVEKDC